MLTGMKAWQALALGLLVGCGRGAPASPESESAPLPALSAVAEETKTPTSDPAPESAQSPTLSMDECRSQPGEVLTDKGDGALHAHGCPDGRKQLGKVRVGIENGLCCAPAAAAVSPPAAPAAGSAGKRAPCTTDQACNDDESISALWGKCTPLGVCECKPGFELNPRGRCQKAVK
jgi:hypothetical protein